MVVTMKNHDEYYFKGKSFGKIVGIVALVLVMLLFAGTMTSEAQDNKTTQEAPLGGTEKSGFPKMGQILPNNEWTSQLLYDTINACYQGTIRWILMSNPSLIGQVPGYPAQRQMIEHCFCVLDKIRKDIKLEEYMIKVYDQRYVGDLFMVKAVECVAEYRTLPSFFTKAQLPDNETKTEETPKIKETPKIEEPSDIEETPKVEDLPESPDQSEENPTGAPTTIFQG